MSKTHINFADIKMTDGKMCFDAPMRLLSKIPHNVYTELVVRNMNCFTVITSDNCR